MTTSMNNILVLVNAGVGKTNYINKIVGINIGKNKSTQSDIDDYLYCVEKLGMYSDYITINISSPNTPGLRDLQLRGRIELLVKKIQAKQSEIEGLMPIAHWDTVFAIQVDSVITNPVTGPVADDSFSIPS